MPSVNERILLNSDRLLNIAWRSIKYGFKSKSPCILSLDDLPPLLLEKHSAFITLTKNKELRGCIGTIFPRFTLAQEVANNAFSAAFRDPRFSPLEDFEFEKIQIEISVLTRPEPLIVDSEEDLLAKIVPGQDGIILTEGRHSATFLPAVWESIPDPKLFITELKLKAGISTDSWPASMQVERYKALKFSDGPNVNKA